MPSTRSDHRPNKVGSLISFRLDVFQPQRKRASAIVRRPPRRIGPKDRSSVSAKQTKKTPVFLDQLLEIMSGDVRSGASIQRIRQMKTKVLKQQIVVTDRASFQNQTLSHLRPARPSTPSMGSAPNNQALNLITWKPPDISSLHNQTFNRHQPRRVHANLIFQKVIRSAATRAPILGGAKRDRTADPLLAKQVLSQLSYSPDFVSCSQWWAREDLNFRPHAYQACALTN